jgi:hypothetical protein
MTRRRWLIVALTAAAAAFALGLVGYWQVAAGPKTWLDLIYHTLQLFVLGSDPLQSDGVHPVALEIARFLAPATTVYALVETLRALWREEWRRRRLARARGHAIVCGDDIISRLLARNLLAVRPCLLQACGVPKPRPSIVVTSRSSARNAGVMQLCTGLPWSHTVQAPQSPASHPFLTP